MSSKLFYTAIASAMAYVLFLLLSGDMDYQSTAEKRATKKDFIGFSVGSNSNDAVVLTPADSDLNYRSGSKPIFEPPANLASLQGTKIPAGLHVNAEGELIKDEHLKFLFDYFLSAINDADIQAVSGAVTAFIASQLEGRAANDAIELWNRYLVYKEKLNNNILSVNKPHSMTQTTGEDVIVIETFFLERKRLQYEILDEVADDWFSDDNDYDAAMLERYKQFLAMSIDDSQAADKDIPKSMQLNYQYEHQRNLILAAEGISEMEKSEAIALIRGDYFPDNSSYIRQTLKDLSSMKR